MTTTATMPLGLGIALALGFVSLIVLGLSMRVTRRRQLRSAMTMPLLFFALSLASVTNAFGLLSWAAWTWIAGVTLAMWVSVRMELWDNIAWSPREKLIILPGSWIPLILMMSIFVIKFSVGFILAVRPMLASNPLFAMAVSLVYGSLSGIFLARNWVMWRITRITRITRNTPNT